MNSCNPCKPICKPKFKLLSSGSSLAVTPHVKRLAISGGSLKVTNSDGTDYELPLPTVAGSSGRNIVVKNATGKSTLAVLMEASI